MRRRYSVSLLVVLLCLFTVTALAQQTQPADDSVTQAEHYAERAFEAYQAKDYTRAVTLYQKAFEAAPSADILYNMARIYDVGLRDRPLAMAFYRRYVADPGAISDRIAVANQRLLQLRAAEDAAVVAVEPQVAPSGETASASSIEQPPQSSEPPDPGFQPTEQPEAEGRARKLKIAGWTLASVGVAGLAVGAAFGVAAMGDAKDAERDCDGNACTTQASVNAAEDGTRKATLSTVAFAAGGAVAATGIVLLIVGAKSASAQEEQKHALSFSPALSPSGLGAQLSGRF